MTAFLPHQLSDTLDTANLSYYGPVVTLLGKHRPSIWQTDQLVEAYRQALDDALYDPRRDYIVLTGKAVYLAMLVFALADYDEVKLLVYDSPSNAYKETKYARTV